MDNVWFSHTVHAAFGFLTTEFGFSEPIVTSVGKTLEPYPPKPNPDVQHASVIYEKGEQFIEAAHGTYGIEFETILGFGSYTPGFPNNCPTIYFQSMLDLVAPDYRYPMAGLIKSLEEKFSFAIQADAQALRLHGKRFFDNDLLLLGEIRNHKSQMQEYYRIRKQNEELRREALAAFKNADWDRAISQYQKISDQLSETELKRLSIAWKRLDDATGGT